MITITLYMLMANLATQEEELIMHMGLRGTELQGFLSLPGLLTLLLLVVLSSILACLLGCGLRTLQITGPRQESSGIRFQLFYKGAKNISVSGNFNDWALDVHFLNEGPPGYWSIILPLPSGRYEYQFIIDQNIRMPDPEADLYLDDGFGQKNSLLVVD